MISPVVGTVSGIDGAPIGFTVRGRGGPALLLIHGWCCHQRFWSGAAAALARHATVVTVDLAGHGVSRRQPGHRASIESLGQDVVAVAEALGLEDLGLVGHSMGGPVAVEAAIRLGARCRLVLGVDTFSDAAFYRHRPPDEVEARVRAFEPAFAARIMKMVRRITLAGGEPLAAWIGAEMGNCDPAVALPALEALLRWDIQARWPLLPCAAETINSAVLSRGSEAVDGLSGLRIHLMDGVGHFPMLEDAPRFTHLALAILRRSLG